MSLESEQPPSPGWRTMFSLFSGAAFTNGLVAFIFAATGPVALVFAAAAKGGLGEADIAAWVFGGFVLNGLISIGFSLAYRQPLVLLWTMPGTVLVGQALTHMPLSDVVGAYIATGVLMLVLGLSGIVGRIMQAVPMPIVMGMVAGVFLQFGLDWVRAFGEAFVLAGAMTAVFFALTIVPAAGRIIPPMIGALAVGIAVAVSSGGIQPDASLSVSLGLPRLVMPTFSWAAIAELVVPLAITVLAVQNGQGIAVLRAAGHEPPVNTVTVACGLGSIVTACMGTVSTCLTGPVSAILTVGVARDRQYVSGVVLGVLALAFGLSAPFLARLSILAPKALIATLAGLAMLKILQTAFSAAFQGPFAFGALIAFLVTVAGQPILNIGAPFWGLVFGCLASYALEREQVVPRA